jgi:hypothetical protein
MTAMVPDVGTVRTSADDSTPRDAAGAMAVTCPVTFCRAEPGERCRGMFGDALTIPHRARGQL